MTKYAETELPPTPEELQQVLDNIQLVLDEVQQARDEVQQELDKLVDEGKIKRCLDQDGEIRYYAVQFVH